MHDSLALWTSSKIDYFAWFDHDDRIKVTIVTSDISFIVFKIIFVELTQWELFIQFVDDSLFLSSLSAPTSPPFRESSI